MQVTTEQLTPTRVKLILTADDDLLQKSKKYVLSSLSRNVKLPGFRQGKAPASMVEKNLDQSVLQSEFLDRAVNALYSQAIRNEELRPVAQPEVSITKFVPFSTLECVVEVDVVGKIVLPDYTNIKIDKEAVSVTAKDVSEVIEDLRGRIATKKEVKRAAKDGDEITIDFDGVDAKTKEPIAGASGKQYPLILGSNSFIPGFETNLADMKAGESKTFDIAFPKNYGVAALQSKKATFTVTVQKVNEVVLPKVDDAFAAQVGPFKSVDELKKDVKKQIESERVLKVERDFQNNILEAINEKTEASIPDSLVEAEIDRMESEERQNILYRGQTWQEHLDEEGVSNEEHREKQRDLATSRVKSGLMLAEIAKKENVVVTDEDIDVRMQLMRAQYTDPQMQAEFDKPETRDEILSRIVSEKTLTILSEYASK